jgi:hypothetical protein
VTVDVWAEDEQPSVSLRLEELVCLEDEIGWNRGLAARGRWTVSRDAAVSY